MKTLTKLRDMLLMWMADIVFKYKPRALNEALNREALKLAQEMAIKTSMAFLDKEKLLHCAYCPQRFGLRRIKIEHDGRTREVMACNAHLSKEMKLPVPA